MRYHSNRQTNRLDHKPHILIDLVIAEPKHAVAAPGRLLDELDMALSLYRLWQLDGFDLDVAS